MHKIIIAITLACCFSIHAAAFALSDSSRVTLLTCTPGAELYSCFGHNGIRIIDSTRGIDLVFNYGTFDFEQPGFYVNFLKGHMIYMLGVDRYEDFRNDYIEEQRNIYEQEIYLSTADRSEIFTFLIDNSKEDKRNYRYDFLFDNCATRIRDVFAKNVSGIHFDYSTFTEKKSFRDLINDYSMTAPWSQFGMNLLIGLPVDRQATPAQMCFLPDYLSRAFAHATIDGRPLCGPKILILDVAKPMPLTLDQRISPVRLFGILLVLIVCLTFIEIRSKKHFYWIDYPLLFISGFLGILSLSLGFTEHTTTQWNFNLLWALPTHLFMVFILPFAKRKKWVLTYFLVSAIAAAVIVIAWPVMPQRFLYSIIFIATIMAIRCYSIYRYGSLAATGKITV